MQVHAQKRFLAELEVAIQHQLEQEDATPGHTVSQAVFDDQPDLFFVDANELVLAYGRDEEVAPSSMKMACSGSRGPMRWQNHGKAKRAVWIG